MLGDLDLARLKKALVGMSEPLEIVFHPTSGRSALSEEMGAVVGQIVAAGGGRVYLRRAPAAERQHLPERPAFSLGWRGKRNIHYLAIPEGPEMLPFIEALRALPAGAAGHSQPWTRLLGGLRRTARLFVFMASSCPNCPRAVRAVLELALVSHEVQAYIIDAQRYPRLADRFAVKSVPTTVLDEGWSRVGEITPGELAERIAGRGSAELDAEVFASLVQGGRLEAAGDWLLEHGAGHFVAYWRRASLAERVALMVLAERLLERRPGALAEAVPSLLELLSSAEDNLRGDTADLLGKLNDGRAIEPLRRLLDDTNPEVVEIATDALQQLLGSEVSGHREKT